MTCPIRRSPDTRTPGVRFGDWGMKAPGAADLTLDDTELVGRVQAELGALTRLDGAAPARFRIVSADDMVTRPATEHLVEGVLERGVVGVMHGDSGTGKTLAALDLACCV